MPQQHIVFNHPINEQVSKGDAVWFIPGGLSQQGFWGSGYNMKAGNLDNAINFGIVHNITGASQYPDVVTWYPTGATLPINGDYVFFVKDERVSKNSIKGYYASVKLKNNSKEKAELFTLSAIVEESSK